MRACVGLMVASVLGLAACGGGQGVTGRVTFTDGSAAAKVAVALTGAKDQDATTGSDGTYTFTSVDDGTYVLSVDIPGTLEGHREVVVAVHGHAAHVPAIVFTAVAALSGTVTRPDGSPASGVEVMVLGTSSTATTDPNGAYAISQVPTGTYTVLARDGSGADAPTAQKTVQLGRGDDAQVDLQLSAAPTGTVTGSVGLPVGHDASPITVSVDGLDLTTQPAADGTFSLDLPPGPWSVEAVAPNYPRQPLGRVTVMSGGSAVLPGKTLSVFRPLPSLTPSGHWTNTMPTNQGSRVLATWIDNSLQQLYSIDINTLDLRLLATSTTGSWMVSDLGPNGTWAAVSIDKQLVALNLSTGASWVYSGDTDFRTLSFSADAATLFAEDSAQFFRIDLATGADDALPMARGYALGGDHYLVCATGPTYLDCSLVTPAQVFSNVFGNHVTAVQTSSASGAGGAVVALQACPDVAGCPIQTIAPGATTAVTTSYYTTTFGLTGFRAQGPWFELSGTPAELIDAANGVAYPLPAGVVSGQINADDTEAAFINAAGTSLYVGTLPDIFTTPVATGTGLQGGWVDTDRYVAFDNDATAPRRLDIAAGDVTPDTDYTADSGAMYGEMALWLRSSDGDLEATLGSAGVIDLGVPAPPNAGTAYDADGTPIPIGAISFVGGDETLVLDGATGSVQHFPGFTFLGMGVGGTSFVGRALTAPYAQVPVDGTPPIPLMEPGIFQPTTQTLGDGTIVAIAPRLQGGSDYGGALAFFFNPFGP